MTKDLALENLQKRKLSVHGGCAADLWRLAVPASAYKVYVSNEKDNTVSVIDSATMEVVKTINVGQRPRGITMSPDGKLIYRLRQRRRHDRDHRCGDA